MMDMIKIFIAIIMLFIIMLIAWLPLLISFISDNWWYLFTFFATIPASLFTWWFFGKITEEFL